MLRFGFENQRHKGGYGFTLSLKPLALSLFFIIFCLLNANKAFAATVSLSWNPPTTNTDSTPLTDLAGYKVYYGTIAGYYTQSIVINNTATTTYQVNNLPDGTTYYFAITAYNTSLRESDYSNERCFNSTGTCTTNGGGESQAPSSPGDTSISGGGCGFIKDDSSQKSGLRIQAPSNNQQLSLLVNFVLLFLFLIFLKLRHVFRVNMIKI
jgi:hypothetical protein